MATLNLQSLIEGLGRKRYQHPSIMQTKGKRPQWYFRARVDVLGDGRIAGRKEQAYYLGFLDQVGRREAERQRDEMLSSTINKPQIILQAQVKFRDVVAAFKSAH